MSKVGDSSASTHNRIIQPQDQSESDLTSVGDYSGHNTNREQSSLNQALLEGINRLNNNFHNFTHQFEAVDTEEIDEGINDNPDNFNILADIEHFSSGDTGKMLQIILRN